MKNTPAESSRPPSRAESPTIITPDFRGAGPAETEPRRSGGRFARWVIFLLIAAGAFFTWRHFAAPRGGEGRGQKAAAMAARPVPVVAGTAEKRDFPITLDGLGTVQAFNSVTVRARVDGEIQQIFFQEGQTVQKGMQLAQIDPRPYQAQYNQAAAKMAQDQAQLANARVILARDEKLRQTGVLDQQTYDTQKYTADQLTALVAADQAALNNTQTQLDYTKLLSPITGRVGIRLVDEGNIVHAADSTGIVVINQVQPISVIFTLPQQQLGEVRDAQQNNEALKVTALDRNNLSPLAEGSLAVIDNQIDQTTATVKLKATFANDDLKLWPGQFVNVELLLGTKKDAVCVRTAAIQRGPDGPYVYVIGEDSTVSMRPIQPGGDDRGWTLVKDGLQAGEQIVVDGQYRLKPGAQVSTSPPEEAGAAANKNPAGRAESGRRKNHSSTGGNGGNGERN